MRSMGISPVLRVLGIVRPVPIHQNRVVSLLTPIFIRLFVRGDSSHLTLAALAPSRHSAPVRVDSLLVADTTSRPLIVQFALQLVGELEARTFFDILQNTTPRAKVQHLADELSSASCPSTIEGLTELRKKLISERRMYR